VDILIAEATHLNLYRKPNASPSFQLFLPALVEALEECCTTLMSIGSTDHQIIFQIAEAVSLCLEFQTSYDKAEQICSNAISLLPNQPLVIMPLLSIRARIQQVKTGRDPSLPENKFAQVIVLLQMLEGEENDPKKIEEGLSKAISILDEAQAAQANGEGDDDGGVAPTLEEDLQWIELSCPLWTRLARNSLDIRNIQQAQKCCEKAVAELPSSPEGRKTLSANIWRWLSLAANIRAQAVVAVISPEGQEQSLQDELRLASMHHLCLAAEWGTQAALSSLVADASAHFWNVSLPLMDSKKGGSSCFLPCSRF